MNEEQVILDLKSQVKPYIGIMPQGSFSNCIIRHKLGILKPATLNSFFEKMGYKKEDGLWYKLVSKKAS